MVQRFQLFVPAVLSALVFVVCTLLTVLLALPLQLLALPWDPDRAVAAWVTRWVWGVGFFRGTPVFRLAITGRERTPGRGRIIVANHQSMLDIPLLMQLPVPVRVTARPGVFRIPLYGWMARFSRQLSIDPEADVEALVTRVRGLLDRGISVVVFPEGTRGDGVSLLPFKRGAFELAIRAEAEVLPVCIHGTADGLRRGGWFPRVVTTRMTMQVLPPIVSLGRSRRELAREARASIEAALTAPTPLDVPDALFELYRPLGRFAAGFAWGKVRFDQVYWAAWERLPREGLVLDLGCGEGLLGASLRAAGSSISVVGLDVDTTRVARARFVATADDHYEVANVLTAPFPSGCAAVVALDLLHYLRPAEQHQLLTKMVAALAPGGVLFLRDPEPGRGVWGGWTVASERAMVAIGRHRGGGVHPLGGAAIAEQLKGAAELGDVRVEDGSAGPFANTLVWARRLALDSEGC